MTEEQRTKKIAEIREAIEILRKAQEMRQEAFELIGKDLKGVDVIEYRTRQWADDAHEMAQLYTGIYEFADVVQAESIRCDGKERYVDFDGVRFLQVMQYGGKK